LRWLNNETTAKFAKSAKFFRMISPALLGGLGELGGFILVGSRQSRG
jgi:hypothetical protein